MKYILCVVHDRSINAYINLHCVRAEGQAIRQFQDAINDPQAGSLHKHPDDYDLYKIGEYIDDDGTIELLPHKQKIADGKQMSITGDL